MDKLPVGQLPDLASSNNDDEIMVITNSEYNQLKKEKISDLITDFTSTDENNALTKGTDGKMFVTDFGNASNITEGTLPVSVLPDIPKDKLPPIETSDLPVSGVTADTYAYPSSVTVNAQGQVTAIEEGSPSGANANTDLSNLTETGESHFANPDLSNLTAEGEKHFLNKTQITNGILAVEKLVNVAPSLDNGRLILKQGSIVYVSTNGTFEEVTISSDVGAGSEELYTDNGSRNIYACYVPSINEIRNIPVIQTYSQATAPTTSMMLFNTYCGWLDTTNNIMKYTYDGGATWTVCSLPFALGNPQTISSGGIGWFGKLKVVFNGFGVVGQKTFTTRGVRALLPNGKNTDETLNNKETISTSLTFMDETGKSSLLCFFSGTRILTYGVPNYFEQDEMPTGFTGSAIWLNTEDNIMYNTSNGGTTWTKTGSPRCYLGKLVKAQNGVITEFEPNKPVELLKRSDLDNIQQIQAPYITETYVNGTSGYLVYSNGFCEQWGVQNAAGDNNTTFTLLKPYKDTNYMINATLRNSSFPIKEDAALGAIPNSTSQFILRNGSGSARDIQWRTLGYIL